MLELFWTDVDNNKYHLGNLYKDNDKFCFDIMEDELKKALKHGCFGIGNIDITKKRQESQKLFDFFKSRIPEKTKITKEDLKEYYGIDEYDEMEILKITEGRLIKDRYYLEYIEKS